VEETTTEPKTYLKIPYNSEKQKQEISCLLKRTDLHNTIRLIFCSSRPLSLLFRPKPGRPTCPSNCLTCKTAEHDGSCFIKNCVYCITCNVCLKVYIGQSKRTNKSRIKEDMTNSKEHVFLHSLEHSKESVDIFRWKILKIVPSLTARLSVESIHIQRNKNNLINGCHGKDILPFLKKQ